jgi:RNA polymerase sigma factor (sigma-70 family)
MYPQPDDTDLEEMFGLRGMHMIDLYDDLPLSPSPEDTLEAHETIGVVYKAIASLPPQQAKLVMLRFGLFGREFSQVDVAEVFGCDPSNVSHMEKRALINLRKILADTPHFENIWDQ